MKIRKTVPHSLLIALCLLFIACSRTEPKIAFGFMELVYYQTEGRPQERFSFFIIPEDDDGIENLEELFLYHDRDQLRWHLKSDDWISYTHDGKTWIGSRSIAATEGETLPRGQYRAVLVNKGGEKSERNFSFDAPEEPRFPFPALQISEGNYTIRSSYPANRLVFYDQEGNFIVTEEPNTLSGPVDSLSGAVGAFSASLWAEDAQYFTSAFTDAVALH